MAQAPPVGTRPREHKTRWPQAVPRGVRRVPENPCALCYSDLISWMAIAVSVITAAIAVLLGTRRDTDVRHPADLVVAQLVLAAVVFLLSGLATLYVGQSAFWAADVKQLDAGTTSRLNETFVGAPGLGLSAKWVLRFPYRMCMLGTAWLLLGTLSTYACIIRARSAPPPPRQSPSRED